MEVHSSSTVEAWLEEFSTICCDPLSQRFCIVSKAEIDVFLELSCYFDDPTDVGSLISGSSAFSIQLEHLGVHGSHTAEAWLGEF